MAADILNPIKELGYLAKREFLLLTGKNVVMEAGVAAGSAATYTPLGILTMGGVAAISAGLSQMDFNHKRKILKELYKEELAAQLGKPADKVTISDLDALAKTNSTVDEEMRRSRKQRNFGVVVAFIATMATLGVIAAVGTLGLTGLALGAVHAVIGMLAYKAIEEPVHWIADKMFGLDDKTVNDTIIGIERDREAGKAISREQVLSAFVAANPELDKLIVANYGKHFDDLDLATKQRATNDINQMIPLDRLTQDINAGRVHATELAFAVHGQASGVYHADGDREEHRHGIKKFLHNVGEKINHSKLGNEAEHIAASHLAPDQFVTSAAMEQAPQKGFVERLKLAKKSRDGSYAEHIEQSRNEQGVSGLQQS